jgi:hypothetical protein
LKGKGRGILMTINLQGEWYTSIANVKGYSYVCGYCGSKAGPSKQYYCNDTVGNKSIIKGNIYICPNCNKPTFINKINEEQVPGPRLGNDIEFLPDDINQLFNEARNCISVNAYTSSVLSCRKLLMNLAVSKGAEVGKSFAHYVSFLSDNHYIPPGSREWVDHIRSKGNEATHEILSMSKEDAIELLEFTGMLLRFVYEMPGKMTKYKS